MRLPATAAGIATWLILSRCALPRLGRKLALNRVAVWTAGAVFLAAWLPFNNGLRPEPLIAFGRWRRGCWWRTRSPPGGCCRGAGDHRRGVQRDAGAAGSDRAGAALVGGRAIARIIKVRRATDGLLARWPPWPPRCR
jgi:arabinosyltransferase A